MEVGSLTGVTEVMDRMINMVAAVSGIPVTVLMGQAPAGLNATTSESDIRSWYDGSGASASRPSGRRCSACSGWCCSRRRAHARKRARRLEDRGSRRSGR